MYCRQLDARAGSGGSDSIRRCTGANVEAGAGADKTGSKKPAEKGAKRRRGNRQRSQGVMSPRNVFLMLRRRRMEFSGDAPRNTCAAN